MRIPLFLILAAAATYAIAQTPRNRPPLPHEQWVQLIPETGSLAQARDSMQRNRVDGRGAGPAIRHHAKEHGRFLPQG
jgi:hypothetical protein